MTEVYLRIADKEHELGNNGRLEVAKKTNVEIIEIVVDKEMFKNKFQRFMKNGEILIRCVKNG